MASIDNKINLETPIKDLYLIGPALAKRFANLGLKTLRDLFYFLPNRFEDRRLPNRPLSQLELPERVTLAGIIEKADNLFSRRGLSRQQFLIIFKNQPIKITFYNQIYLLKTLKPGTKVAVWGKLSQTPAGYQLEAVNYEVLTAKPAIHSLAIIPIYPETRGLTNKTIHKIILFYLNKLNFLLPQEYLPDFILKKENYPLIGQAFKDLHQPATLARAEKAKERFLFEQILIYQINVSLKRQEWQKKQSRFENQLKTEKIIQDLQTSSNLKLSPSQSESLKTILTDLSQNRPMNRLLLGDVGSGKTLIAAGAAYATILNSWRAILMTPTDVLAKQTFLKFKDYLPRQVKIGLYTQTKKYPKDDWQILIGTQALLWKNNLEKVGLIVIDEQHRFGVRQRSQLINGLKPPHILTMSATPIPRSLALTFFGHLDLSYLEPLADKVKQTKTYLLKPGQVIKAYDWIIKQLSQNQDQRAFIITPLIDVSAKETMKDIKAVTSLYQQLVEKYPRFPYFGLLHGRLKAKEKDKIINQFKAGKIKVLISTSVVEVGIDISQANIILIEGAERFGLAQLHQLRGRVGRVGQKSYCFLAPTKFSSKSYRRLKYLTYVHSGHKLAEYDLKLRGPGQVFGLAQHGFPKELFPLLNDVSLLAKAQKYGREISQKWGQFSNLQEFYLQGKIKDISFT